MAQQYVIAVSLIALMAVLAISRWAAPNNDLLVYIEAKKMAQVMYGLARQRCVADVDTSDGSTLSSQLLPSAEHVLLVDFINSGAVAPEEVGFAKDVTLPLSPSPDTITSPNTAIIWRLVGWQNGSALVEAESVTPRSLAVLKQIFPVHTVPADNTLRFVVGRPRGLRARDDFTYLSEELFYADLPPADSALTAYALEKRICLM